MSYLSTFAHWNYIRLLPKITNFKLIGYQIERRTDWDLFSDASSQAKCATTVLSVLSLNAQYCSLFIRGFNVESVLNPRCSIHVYILSVLLMLNVYLLKCYSGPPCGAHTFVYTIYYIMSLRGCCSFWHSLRFIWPYRWAVVFTQSVTI